MVRLIVNYEVDSSDEADSIEHCSEGLDSAELLRAVYINKALINLTKALDDMRYFGKAATCIQSFFTRVHKSKTKLVKHEADSDQQAMNNPISGIL